MGKLVLHMTDGSLHDILLSKERLTIGRRTDNDVCLPYPAVSGEHAAIVTILNDSFLEDLGSTNGTLVNGQRVLKHLLRNNDHIDIGRQRMVYLANDDAMIDRLPPDVLLRDLTGLRDQVERARTRRTDKPGAVQPGPLVIEDDEILIDLEQAAAGLPMGAELNPRMRATQPAAAGGVGHGPAAAGGDPRRAREAGAARHRVRAESPFAAPDVSMADVRVAVPSRLESSEAVVPALEHNLRPRTLERKHGGGYTDTLSQPLADVSALESTAAESTAAESTAAESTAAEPASSAPAAGRSPSLWLRVVTGPATGREVALNGNDVTLGSIGWQVARLALRDGAWLLLPLEGDEPLVLNGAPVSVQGAFVAPGDRFHVAGSEIEVERR